MSGWRLSILVLLGMVGAAAADVKTDREARGLPLPKGDDVFHFAVFGDRTGGPADGVKILAQAVEDTNLLDPDLVMTVGDLINGYNQPKEWMEQMEEYRGIMAGLKMPWFPVAGNHDIYWRGPDWPPEEHEVAYEKHFGPLWYWFEHKGCGFLVLYTDEGDAAKGPKQFNDPAQSQFSERQLTWLRKSLGEMKALDQVFVFLHHPRWVEKWYPGSNWKAAHAAMVEAGNVSAVFAGHIHRLHYGGKVDGIEYFALASVGAHIPYENVGVGYLHHYNVVSVREGGFSMGVVPVGAVVDARTYTMARQDEIDALRRLRFASPDNSVVLGSDGTGAGYHKLVVKNPVSRAIEVTAKFDARGGGWVAKPEHGHFKLEPGEEREVAFSCVRTVGGFGEGFSEPRMMMQVDYLAEDARVSIPEVAVAIPVGLGVLEPGAFEGKVDRAAKFSGKDGVAVAVADEVLGLPEGAFTVEAWVRPRETTEHAGIVSKAEKSGFVLSIKGGVPRFKIHSDGEYRKVEAGAPLGSRRWTHMAGVYDGKEVRLYLAGYLVGQTEAPGTMTATDLPMLVGADPDGKGKAQMGFDGLIDEVRVSEGVRYEGERFEPEERFVRDEATRVLLHFDERIWKYVPSDDGAGRHGLVVGGVGLVE